MGSIMTMVGESAVMVAGAIDNALPTILQYYVLCKEKVELGLMYVDKYSTPEINTGVLGFFLCFYGGQFPALIAATTAVHQSGQWPNLLNGLSLLLEQTKEAFKVLEDDAIVKKLDADNDGKVSLAEIAQGFKDNSRGLIVEAAPLVMKKVDPDVVNEAVTSVWVIIMSVMVTLQSHFAQQVALGMRVGDIVGAGLREKAMPLLTPYIEGSMEKVNKVWVEYGIKVACKGVGVFIAMFMSKLIGGFHAALQGGQQVAILVEDANMKDVEMGVTYVLAAIGFLYQLRSGFTMNILFQLILMPAFIGEYALNFFVFGLGK